MSVETRGSSPEQIQKYQAKSKFENFRNSLNITKFNTWGYLSYFLEPNYTPQGLKSILEFGVTQGWVEKDEQNDKYKITCSKEEKLFYKETK